MKLRFALAALALGLAGFAGASDAAVLAYRTTLSGPAEEPPNDSPGFGSARVVVDTTARTYSIDTDFFDLSAPTTVAHIHGPTLAPGTGTAGVMTTVPTFPGFPAGVTSGSYSHFFETDVASTYNPDFVTAQGGTIDAAEAAFLAALASGSAYLNIHTTAFPSGEIRGFFEPAPIPLPAGALLSLTALAALGAIRLRGSRSA